MTNAPDSSKQKIHYSERNEKAFKNKIMTGVVVLGVATIVGILLSDDVSKLMRSIDWNLNSKSENP